MSNTQRAEAILYHSARFNRRISTLDTRTIILTDKECSILSSETMFSYKELRLKFAVK